MTEEWTDWFPYCGEGFLPGVDLGMIVQVKALWRGELHFSEPRVVTEEIMFSRIVEGPDEKLIAYRIRKPAALQQLRDIAADPVREDA